MITTNAVPCAVIKLGPSGANPALKIQIYTGDTDPTAGGGIIRK